MATKNKHRFKAPRAGTAAVEFAVLLPLLVTLCLASVDFGRFAYGYIALENAVRVGGEFAATHSYSSSTEDEFRARVEAAIREDFGSSIVLDPDELAVEVEIATDDYNLNRIEVEVAYPFTTVLAWPQIPQPLLMNRSIVFRRFR